MHGVVFHYDYTLKYQLEHIRNQSKLTLYNKANNFQLEGQKMLICNVQDYKNLCKRKQLIRFNDACQEATVCRETQLASFCKLFDIHIFLVHDYQLCKCHRGQFSLQIRIFFLFSKLQVKYINIIWCCRLVPSLKLISLQKRLKNSSVRFSWNNLTTINRLKNTEIINIFIIQSYTYF